MELVPRGQINLSQHEPLDVLKRDGLIVSTYEVEGEMIMSFDWEPGSQWEALESEEVFRAFADSFWQELLAEAKETIEQGDCKTCQEACTLNGHSPV